MVCFEITLFVYGSALELIIHYLFCFQYFVFEYNQSSAVLFDKMITITVSIRI